MTYCIGLYLDSGLVMLADTRTNAGLDNISVYRKMFTWNVPGERTITMMTAGNLAISQAVVNILEEGFPAKNDDKEDPEDKDDDLTDYTMATVPSMFMAARLVGAAVREVWRHDGEALQAQEAGFNASFILGGQIKGRRMRLFNVYSAGNFIEATPDTPYFQIGEHKYGKPILDRAMAHETDLASAVKLCLLSMDSTLSSNLSVGMPIDLLVYEKDSLDITLERRIEADDDYYNMISESWSEALRQAHQSLPNPSWFKT